MKAPSAFNLPNPVSQTSHPPPAPPKYLKHEVYEKSDVFSRVDDHAIQVAKIEHPTFRDLVWHLLFKYSLNDLEMARAIFRWLASKELYNLRFDETPPGSPEEFLMSFTTGQVALANIFELMCSFCGLHCVTVSGYAKGVDYLPGDKFIGSPANHSWNVVFIRGSWQLIDVLWAARYLSSSANTSENVVYEYDDFYFMMEPQQAIYSHFPDDPSWQLLPDPLALPEFESLPLTRPQFFKCAMDFLGHHHGVIRSREGHLTMTLGFWRPTGFTHRLRYLRNSSGHKNAEALPTSFMDLVDQLPGIETEMKNFSLQETTSDRVNYHFRLPVAGVFYLTVYAQELSQLIVGRESTFRTACEYKIVCDYPTEIPLPYPPCRDPNWGPSWSHMQHYGLEPDHVCGIITVKPDWTEPPGSHTIPTATVNLRFTKTRPEVRLLAKLHQVGMTDDALDQYQHIPDKQSHFQITLPEPGEYGYEIYANEPAEKETYTHVCQYLLRYEASSDERPVARLTASGADAGPSPEAVRSWRRPAAAGGDDNYSTMRSSDNESFLPDTYIGAQQSKLYSSGSFRDNADLATPLSTMCLNSPPGSDSVGKTSSRSSLNRMTLEPLSPRPGVVRYATSTRTEVISAYRNNEQYDRVATARHDGVAYGTGGYQTHRSTANWGPAALPREPPKEFSLHPLAVESYFDKPRPQELPDLGEKAPLPHESFENFRRVDEHAVFVSQQQQDSFKQLIWQLIYARNITDEMEKTRVIFLWLCTKDLHKMNFDHVKPDSPEDILMGIRTGKSTYAQIFYTMCKYAGLHCKLLIGYAKGAEYAPGMHFSGGQGEHSWNAVLIDKVWRLVDCHWAARRLIGKRPSSENVRYGLDMFYFLANPGQLIYTHFPHDPDWQLLRHPITLAEFENLAPVKSAFFKYNLDLVTHRDAVITCIEPEICVAIAFPPQSEPYLSFIFGLSMDNKEASESYRGMSLGRYGRQEISRDHKALFYIRPPAPGAYKLLIYANHRQLDSTSGTNGTEAFDTQLGSRNKYGAVCEYRLVAKFGPNVSLPPYPPCQSPMYGPSNLVKDYPIQAVTSECTIRAVRGCAEVRFILGTTPGGVPVRMLAQLRCTFVPEEVLSRCLLQRAGTGNREAIFMAFLPEAGEYGLEVYANNPSKSEKSFSMVWQYIILSDSESPVRGLPALPPAYLGPMPRFEAMGLVAVSHPDSFVQAKGGELCIQLNCRPDLPIRIMAQLIHATHDVSEDCSQYVMQQMRDNQVFFLIRFPYLGFFKFQIYALPMSEPGETLPGVFNYLLQSTQLHRTRTGQVMCFPQQFAQWKEGCYLHSPMDGIISSGTTFSYHSPDTVPFKLVVPKARAVAVVVGDDWTHLTKMADCWEGQVLLKHHWGRSRQLSVCANSSAADGTYSTILEYQLST